MSSVYLCGGTDLFEKAIELRLDRNGIHRNAEDVMEDMKHLHSILSLTDGRRNVNRRLEQPTQTQAEVLSAFGHRVDKSGVLQGQSN